MSDEPHPVIPSPDPSAMTTDAIARVGRQRDDLVHAQLEVGEAHLEALRVEVTTRLNAIDKATELFTNSLIRVPTDVDKQVGNLKELLLTRFSSVDQRFVDLASRTTEDKRVAQEALVAALAAAKELVGKQNEFSAAAIDKSETNTNKTIEKNRELAEAVAAAIGRQVDDMKDTVSAVRNELTAVASTRSGAVDQRTDSRASLNLIYGAIGAFVAIAVLGLSLYAALKP